MEKIKVTIEGQEFVIDERKFSSGRMGFGLYGKITLGDKQYRMSCNIFESGKVNTLNKSEEDKK